jgi:RsmE family RNA methyltransferase
LNLLLLEPGELVAPRVLLEGRRARHLIEVLRVAPGRRLRVGVLGGPVGEARVLELVPGSGQVLIEVCLPTDARPPRGPLARVRLLCALPRPKALRRLLAAVASLGLGRLDLVNAWRVDRSYFQSPLLEPEALRLELLQGCEQGGQTVLPEVRVEPLLVPVLDGLGAPTEGELRILAEPSSLAGLETLDLSGTGPVLCAIGPEGGFVERELESLARLGFLPVRLSAGILRSEVAVSVLLGQLELLLR